jgi:hypothetical protein
MAPVWRTDTAYADRRIWFNLLYTMYSEQALTAKAIAQSFFSQRKYVGGAGRDRTDDPLLAKQVLSQLSYSPETRLST